MAMNRRDLLKWMALTGGAAAAPGWVWAMPGSSPVADRLVVIFLRGAADGLSIAAPLGESRYFDLRPTLAVPESEALALDGFFGMHPAGAGLKSLFDAGELAIVHATGLHTAQRSHFEAQAAMEQGIDASELAPGDGWIGRYMSSIMQRSPLSAVALDRAVPQSMGGLNSALAIGSVDEFGLDVDAGTRERLHHAYRRDPLLRPTADALFDAIDAMAPVQGIGSGEGYPADPVGMALADTARLIKSDAGVRVAAVNAGGWDHHDEQIPQMETVLGSLSSAVEAFRNDLGAAWETTTLVIQTEFGRRVAENASGGTDHGHGGTMLVAGGGVNGGQVYGDWPGLNPSSLTDGQDLAVTTDYRQVLAEMLAQRLGVSDFEPIFQGWQPEPWSGIFRPAAAAMHSAGKHSPKTSKTPAPPPIAAEIRALSGVPPLRPPRHAIPVGGGHRR
jgi:uncharacterized protein (DUF1501 family)